MSFKELGLSDALVQGILATGYEAPTEIQSRAIPLAVEGHDIIGLAQTGTGKTAAFVLPMLHRLSFKVAEKKRLLRALVLSPTRELAGQIEASIKEYGRFMKFYSLSVYGGTDMRRQIRDLNRGYDILIATPGRLLDHLGQGTIDLSSIEILVLDEADRMLDMGFVQDVKKIISFLPKERQTLLFSATMSSGIQALTASVQKNPHVVEVGTRRKTADSVTQTFYKVPQEKKFDLLCHILETVELDSVLVFSRTKHGADKIQDRLDRRGIKAVAIHSNRTQAQRERALNGFRKKHFKVLVATDIAARGIDIDGISHVINFDIPTYAEDYVHRIGRTGRATSTGDAITFVSSEEFKHFKSISHFVGKRFEIGTYPGFDYAAPSSNSRAHERSASMDVVVDGEDVSQDSEEPSFNRAPRAGGRSGGRSGGRFRSGGGESSSRSSRFNSPRGERWSSDDRKGKRTNTSSRRVESGSDSRTVERKSSAFDKPKSSDGAYKSSSPRKKSSGFESYPKKGFGSSSSRSERGKERPRRTAESEGSSQSPSAKLSWKNQSDQERFSKLTGPLKKRVKEAGTPPVNEPAKSPPFRAKKAYPLFDSEERKKELLKKNLGIDE